MHFFNFSGVISYYRADDDTFQKWQLNAAVGAAVLY